jgi:hypothetical protein
MWSVADRGGKHAVIVPADQSLYIFAHSFSFCFTGQRYT